METKITPYIIGCTTPDEICCILANEDCINCPLNEKLWEEEDQKANIQQ